jgi:uncharacterized protein YciI
MEAVAEAARDGRPPAAETLAQLGVPAAFASVFIERLNYLLKLRAAGVLRAAGPFADLEQGLYLCNVRTEDEARRVLEQDPLYRAGYIERDFTVRRWLAAI